MTVQEHFEAEQLDKYFIVNTLDDSDSDYWTKCQSFITQWWRADTTAMSGKQHAWFNQILDDCVEKRIEG